ncbi:hypothetical protein [Aliivibrio fischeri]|uniref:hypothetical protein n=1 Tax=Aliivibrio fischeri TaxID=668 RepID=UPI00080E7028|nr:hypothetical protein [Aliivibrio fischeri]OCH42555.1 hypothetical protein A6E02_13305 [Aliivibrio fischeri]OED55743.1 hypothetical protein BEI47_02970 [Aliivibrio fischeri]
MEYSFDFARRMIDSAECLFNSHANKEEAGRAILYLSCLSCEISMKALLEQTGYTVKELRGFSHKLHDLLIEISSCEYRNTGYRASSIRSKIVIENTANGTVGALLASQVGDTSTYPNEIRYGAVITHFSPEVMLKCAKVVLRWCAENQGNLIRVISL